MELPKKLTFGDPQHIQKLHKLEKKEELKKTGKKFKATIDFDEVILSPGKEVFEIYALNKEDAEQLAIDELFESYTEEDDVEVHSVKVEEIQEKKTLDSDNATLEMFPCVKKDLPSSSY